MGIFDNIDALKNLGSNQLGAIKELIDNTPGGVTGLVQKFKDQGLGNIVESWMSKGENLPISADQLQQVLGSGTINSIAQKLGVDPQKAIDILTQILPTVMGHLNGLGEGGGVMGMVKGVLGNFLGKK